MQHDHRRAVGVAALLHVEMVAVAHIQHPLIERVDRREQMRRCALLAGELVHDGILYRPPWRSDRPTGANTRRSGEMSMNTAPTGDRRCRRDRQVRGDGRRMVGPERQVQAAAHAQPLPAGLHHRADRGGVRARPETEKPFAGLRILDIGCGGGLLSEPMARLGADVVGADAAERNIPVARVHAEQSGLTIDYRHTTAEAMAAAGEQFDVVLNMEVVEHVADPQAYLTACQELLKPGGLMICSTINRNPKSFAMAIVGAEYVMRWLPKGTHEWSKFITPDELFDLIRNAGLTPVTARASSSTRSPGAGRCRTATCR
jgi:ubiquinone biosynthesis O-methyltransferase